MAWLIEGFSGSIRVLQNAGLFTVRPWTLGFERRGCSRVDGSGFQAWVLGLDVSQGSGAQNAIDGVEACRVVFSDLFLCLQGCQSRQ